MLTTTSRAVTGATTRYHAPRRSGRSTAVFNRAQWVSPSGLLGRSARDTESRLDERFHGREFVAAGARELLEVGNKVLDRRRVHRQQSLVQDHQRQIDGAGPAGAGVSPAFELLQHRPGVLLRGADGDGEVLMGRGHGVGLNNAQSAPPGKRGYRPARPICAAPMRRLAVARKISRKNDSNPRKNATIAATNRSATGTDASNRRKAPIKSMAMTAHTSNAVIVHRVMDQLTSLARRASVVSCRSIAAGSAGFAAACVSRALARSITRARRFVITASIAPMPESRKTGATDSWITWAIAVMPESCSIAVYLTASRKHRVRDAPPHVHAHPGSQRADHEGRHRSDARAEPPADRATDARAEQGENLGHLTDRARRALDRGGRVVPRRLTGWNAQGLPVGTPQRLGHVDDLTNVVARVRERTMQRLGHRERPRPDRHRALEIRVGEVGEDRQ